MSRRRSPQLCLRFRRDLDVGPDRMNSDGGTATDALPSMRMEFRFEATDAGSRVTTTHFHSLWELDELIGMGMEEGMSAAMGQMDDVLADLASFAAGRACVSQVLSDRQVRVSRVVRGPVEQVWTRTSPRPR